MEIKHQWERVHTHPSNWQYSSRLTRPGACKDAGRWEAHILMGAAGVCGSTNTTSLENNLTIPAMVKVPTPLHPAIPHSYGSSSRSRSCPRRHPQECMWQGGCNHETFQTTVLGKPQGSHQLIVACSYNGRFHSSSEEEREVIRIKIDRKHRIKCKMELQQHMKSLMRIVYILISIQHISYKM